MQKTFSIPQNLHLEQIIASDPPSFEYQLDNFHFLLNLIYEIPARNMKNLTQQGYTKMYSPIIQSYLHDYKKHLEYLQMFGIIESNGYYVVGGDSTGYRFTKTYRNVPLTEREVKSPAMKRKMMRFEKINQSAKKDYPELFEWLTCLEIDKERALQINEDIFQENWGIHHDDPFFIYEINKRIISFFERKEFFFTKDDFAGRIHSNLSNLPTKFRECISYKGKPLVSIDIKNSQPYLYIRCLESGFFTPPSKKVATTGLLYSNVVNLRILEEKARQKNEIANRTRKNKIENKSYKKQFDNAKRLYQDLERRIHLLPLEEVDRYSKAVVNGSIYEEFIDLVLEKEHRVICRKKAKQVTLQSFFSSPRWLKPKKAWGKRLFKVEYPEIFNFTEATKSLYKNHLACILQSMESELVLKRIVPRIQFEHPDLFIATIHDCLITTIGNENFIKKEIQEVCQDGIGHPPKISYEYWLPKS